MYRFRHSPTSPRLIRALVLAATTACTAIAVADDHTIATNQAARWHADLARATAAARGSQRPVLAVFTARWIGASEPLSGPALASPEAEALLAACFEPVCLDVDEHAELARKLGVTHVPMVCVFTAEDVLIASFELPTSAPEFVAATARAAQQAALVATGGTGDERDALRIKVSPAPPAAGAANAFADRRPSTRGENPHDRGAAPGSIALVTAKVRQLSNFANDAPSATDAPNAIATRYQEGSSGFAQATTAAAPTLSRTPPAWPAEIPGGTAVAASSPAPRGSSAIEPAATGQSRAESGVPPWLGAPATQAVQPASPSGVVAGSPIPFPGPDTAPSSSPASAATAIQPPRPVSPPIQPPSQAPATGLATAPPAPPEAKKPSAGSPQAQFIAALQKPFWFLKPSTSDKTSTIAATPPPPTMPPARPQTPGTPAAVAAYGATSTTSSSAAAADLYGSMPLGLEGYCPVTVAEQGVWTEGRAQWGARHRGRTYLFAGPEQQQAFLADPDRYAPALSGDDPVLALESGKSTPGQRCYGVTYQSRMYLFANPETRTAFATNPSRYTGRVAMVEQPSASMATVRR